MPALLSGRAGRARRDLEASVNALMPLFGTPRGDLEVELYRQPRDVVGELDLEEWVANRLLMGEFFQQYARVSDRTFSLTHSRIIDRLDSILDEDQVRSLVPEIDRSSPISWSWNSLGLGHFGWRWPDIRECETAAPILFQMSPEFASAGIGEIMSQAFARLAASADRVAKDQQSRMANRIKKDLAALSALCDTNGSIGEAVLPGGFERPLSILVCAFHGNREEWYMQTAANYVHLVFTTS